MRKDASLTGSGVGFSGSGVGFGGSGVGFGGSGVGFGGSGVGFGGGGSGFGSSEIGLDGVGGGFGSSKIGFGWGVGVGAVMGTMPDCAAGRGVSLGTGVIGMIAETGAFLGSGGGGTICVEGSTGARGTDCTGVMELVCARLLRAANTAPNTSMVVLMTLIPFFLQARMPQLRAAKSPFPAKAATFASRMAWCVQIFPPRQTSM